MDGYSEDIKRLYTAVLEKHSVKFGVDERAISNGIGNLGRAYAPNPKWERDQESKPLDFNNAGHRCAYLSKYAMLHTGLVYDVFQQALNIYSLKHNLDDKDQLNLCSLGSGPGSDIVGLLFALEEKFGPKRCSASLIDCSVQWRHVFELVVSEMVASDRISSREHFTYEYLGCNLLAAFNDDVRDAVKKADVLTMIKFVSAAACKDTQKMLKKICFDMRPGAMLLFVDNAAGGFYEMMEKITKLCGFESVFGPWKHYDYEEPLFNIQWPGYTSQYKTKVTVEIWKKIEIFPQNTTMQLQQEFYRKGSLLNENRISNQAQFYDEIDSIRPNVQLQCSKGPFHETDNVQLESFRLHAENDTESATDSGCCIIM